MKIYVIEVYHNSTKESSISQECYTDIKNAQKFILSRYDNPEKYSDWLYVTKDKKYLIHELKTF